MDLEEFKDNCLEAVHRQYKNMPSNMRPPALVIMDSEDGIHIKSLPMEVLVMDTSENLIFREKTLPMFFEAIRVNKVCLVIASSTLIIDREEHESFDKLPEGPYLTQERIKSLLKDNKKAKMQEAVNTFIFDDEKVLLSTAPFVSVPGEKILLGEWEDILDSPIENNMAEVFGSPIIEKMRDLIKEGYDG